MNARQKAKKYKKKIKTLEFDNELMRSIIADTPAMQELYDVYNRPKFVRHGTMVFQKYAAKRTIPVYMADIEGVIEHTKQALAEDLVDGIKEYITYEVDTKSRTPIITASLFIGIEEW